MCDKIRVGGRMRLISGLLALSVLSIAACDESPGKTDVQTTDQADLESNSMYDFQIEKVLRSGGSMRVSPHKFYDFQLTKMAAAAAEGGGRLIVVGWKGKLYDFQMEKISASGPGHVEFE